MSVAAIVGFAMLGGLALLFVRGFRRRPPTRPCPACQGKLVERGFVSWNGGVAGFRVLTAGIAAPTDAFVASLRGSAAGMPDAQHVRVVGALTLLECSACATRFVGEQGVGLRACDDVQWGELTRGTDATSPPA